MSCFHGMHRHFCVLFTVLTSAACRAVKEFAENFKQSGRKLHCLVNNAGTALPPHSITENSFEVCQLLDHIKSVFMLYTVPHASQHAHQLKLCCTETQSSLAVHLSLPAAASAAVHTSPIAPFIPAPNTLTHAYQTPFNTCLSCCTC